MLDIYNSPLLCSYNDNIIMDVSSYDIGELASYFINWPHSFWLSAHERLRIHLGFTKEFYMYTILVIYGKIMMAIL